MENSKNKTLQRETKSATNGAIKCAELFDPAEGWKFKFLDIPTDENIYDYWRAVKCGETDLKG
jgi:predicted Zn-dependent protease